MLTEAIIVRIVIHKHKYRLRNNDMTGYTWKILVQKVHSKMPVPEPTIRECVNRLGLGKNAGTFNIYTDKDVEKIIDDRSEKGE